MKFIVILGNWNNSQKGKNRNKASKSRNRFVQWKLVKFLSYQILQKNPFCLLQNSCRQVKKHNLPIALIWQYIDGLCCSHADYTLVFYLCGNQELQRWNESLGHHQSLRLGCKHIVVGVPGPDKHACAPWCSIIDTTFNVEVLLNMWKKSHPTAVNN